MKEEPDPNTMTSAVPTLVNTLPVQPVLW